MCLGGYMYTGFSREQFENAFWKVKCRGVHSCYFTMKSIMLMIVESAAGKTIHRLDQIIFFITAYDKPCFVYDNTSWLVVFCN